MIRIGILFYLFFSLSAVATNYKDYLFFHNSNNCSNYFEFFEKKYNIPKHLLRSISIVESGRWNDKSQTHLPWPWAVNQAGKSYYFNSKEEAIEEVKKMLSKGLTNIDIGCMQINLHHHPSAFYNLYEAFEPKDNIAYAAYFLNGHYKMHKNWQKAVAAYHSQAIAGYAYATKVLKIHTKYQQEKFTFNYFSTIDAKTKPCKTATKTTLNTKITNKNQKESLPSTKRNTKVSSKDKKRRKSAMILYSSNSELYN